MFCSRGNPTIKGKREHRARSGGGLRRPMAGSFSGWNENFLSLSKRKREKRMSWYTEKQKENKRYPTHGKSRENERKEGQAQKKGVHEKDAGFSFESGGSDVVSRGQGVFLRWDERH